jgi:hypothetical protein
MFKADFIPQKPTENLSSGFPAEIGNPHITDMPSKIPTENVFFKLLVLELAESQILIIFGAFVGALSLPEGGIFSLKLCKDESCVTERFL